MSTPMSPLHKAWYGAVLGLGMLFLLVMPPFQGNDEWPHWVRAWTIAHGEVTCGDITQGALDAPQDFPFTAGRGRLRYENLRQALKRLPSDEWASAKTTSACAYWPLSYLQPAMVGRMVALEDGKPKQGGMILAFYAMRATSWLTMSAFLLWALLVLPWARNLLLAFYSIPEVVQQSTVLNNDMMLFALSLVLLVIATRQPSWRRVAVMTAVIVLMTMTKPVFILLAPIVAPSLLELRASSRTRRYDWRHAVTLLVLVPLPLALRRVWTAYVHFDEIVWLPPWNVHPDQQVAFLKEHPLHLFVILWSQLKATFGHELMHGSWTSVLGGFGSSELEMPLRGYVWCFAAIGAGLAADLLSRQQPPAITTAIAGSRQERLAWVAALLGVLGIFPAVIVAMYLLFTTVAADTVNGVQGRYYLIPLLLLTAGGVWSTKRRVPARLVEARASTALAGLGAMASVLSLWTAIEAVAGYYWQI